MPYELAAHTEPLSVYEGFVDGTGVDVLTDASAEEASLKAAQIIESFAVVVGRTVKVIICDADDIMVFHWTRKSGRVLVPSD